MWLVIHDDYKILCGWSSTTTILDETVNKVMKKMGYRCDTKIWIYRQSFVYEACDRYRLFVAPNDFIDFRADITGYEIDL